MRFWYLQKVVDLVRGKDHALCEIIRGKFISDKYRIIPIGSFCLPRAITTFCCLKKKRILGEKTYPFDLAFFYDFDTNVSLIKNRFENFYDNLEYDSDACQYKNTKLNCFFIHDGKLTVEEFKERYNKRIENLYADISEENKTIYLIWASYELITEEQINSLINVVKGFRNNKFKIILLYCNVRNTVNYNSDYVSVIDNIDIAGINTNKGWADELTKRKSKQAKSVYNYLNKELRKIIK